jgi:hypothetical protein
MQEKLENDNSDIAGFECGTYETQSTDPTRKHLPGEILGESACFRNFMQFFEKSDGFTTGIPTR